MSLSQKHSGLILVPWFNRHEWNYVFENVYFKEKERQVKALELLKVWKLRTPVLPAGVEGTLIILESLLTDKSVLSDEQVCHLYAIGIMRFLNLSAANSERQGEFSRKSSKNELPKWLVNLRHDVAHGHQIPSRSSLKMGLEYGLQWLLEKYWEPQSKILRDYNKTEESTVVDFSSFLKTYVDIKMTPFTSSGEAIEDIILKKLKQFESYDCITLEILEEMVRQSLPIGGNRSGIGKCIGEILVSDKALLFSKVDNLSEETSINKNFRDVWTELFNILHEKKLLFVLVEKLYESTLDSRLSEWSKTRAALWVYEIIRALFEQKSPCQVTSEENCIKLQSNNITYEKESCHFQEVVLKSPNEYSLLFVQILLEYNGNSESFIADAVSLVKNRHKANVGEDITDKIFSLEDLNIEDEYEDKSDIEYPVDNLASHPRSIKKITSQPKWTKIEDTSSFNNCPLGVLPHQIYQKHPFILV